MPGHILEATDISPMATISETCGCCSHCHHNNFCKQGRPDKNTYIPDSYCSLADRVQAVQRRLGMRCWLIIKERMVGMDTKVCSREMVRASCLPPSVETQPGVCSHCRKLVLPFLSASSFLELLCMALYLYNSYATLSNFKFFPRPLLSMIFFFFSHYCYSQVQSFNPALRQISEFKASRVSSRISRDARRNPDLKKE